jgi:hypothetical protein
MTKLSKALFPLGQVVATPGALDALGAERIEAEGLLKRHASGDWGELSADDRAENERSLQEGFRIFSAYVLSRTRVKLWVITEADRSATTLLLPDEY